MTETQNESTSSRYRLRIATGITAVLVLLTIHDAIFEPPLEQSLIGALVALAVAWGGLGADYARRLGR